MKIYCPKCHFEPPPSMKWKCEESCGHVWNTFSTHGVCPKCKKMWLETQCPACKLWSLHDDWYHDGLNVPEKTVEETFRAN
jgi:hypothetical protein